MSYAFLRLGVPAVVALALAAGCGTSECPPGNNYDSVFCHVPAPTDAGTTDLGPTIDRPALDITPDECADAGVGATCGAGLRCSAYRTCTCGNRQIDPGEDCDDGTNAAGSGCEPSCVYTCAEARPCPATPMTEPCAGPTTCDATTHRCVRLMPSTTGTGCGTMRVCDGRGACVDCSGGAACATATPCRVGTLSCEGGSPVCTETGNAMPGTGCGTGMVCSPAGACVACNAGETCTSTNPCHTATLDCSTGAPVCTDRGNRPPGTGCGMGMVCGSAGTCAACAAGDSCMSTNPCHTAAIDCSTGAPVCMDTGNRPAGADCGTNMVCNPMGACVSCHAGMACTSMDPCHTAAIECTSGAPVCRDTGNRPPGTGCGAGLVCNSAGTCGACAEGTPCMSTNPCHTATVSCMSGAAVCTDRGNQPDRTDCGGGHICLGGTCSPCTSNAHCMGGMVCVAGSCAPCSMSSQCTGGMVCRAGSCMPCANNADCTGGQACIVGACQACTSTTQCNPGQVCAAGACIACISCTPGQIDRQSCGRCGMQTRTCSATCGWGAWSACTGEGVCSPGASAMQACGNCGRQSHSCNGYCMWDPWGPCSGEGVCSPGSTTTSGCGPCQTKTCSSTCAWSTACTGCGGCSGFSACGLGCSSGYHSTSYSFSSGCGSCCSNNQTRCEPNCGSSFSMCGLGCPSGYHPTSYSFSSGCGSCCSNNQTRCELNAGASFSTCGLGCPSGYHSTSYSFSSGCGSCCSNNQTSCAQG